MCPCQKTQPFLPLQKKDSNGQEKTYVKNDSVQYPNYGNLFGELIINDCNVDANLFFGDNDVALRNGVGIYAGSFVPGYGGTILVAGHNNTYFNGLKNAKQSVGRLKSRQATVITFMKSPTRLSKKRLTEPHMTFLRIMKIL